MPQVPYTENMAQGITDASDSEESLVSAETSFAWGSHSSARSSRRFTTVCSAKLVTDWWEIPDFSHGFLVPFLRLYLVWSKKETLLKTKIAPTWSGIGVVALGLVVLLLGVYGAELFLSRVSLVILLVGLVLCFWRMATAEGTALPYCWCCCWPFRFLRLSSTR
jgi:hypothetical protein